MCCKPIPHVAVSVIRRVVLYPDHRLRVIPTGDLLKKLQIGLGIEYLLAAIEEARRVDLDAAEYFHTAALAGHGYLWLTATARPSGVQRRVLAEARLVGVDQRGAVRSRLFFRFGYV
jgi:hypothetical protein